MIKTVLTENDHVRHDEEVNATIEELKKEFRIVSVSDTRAIVNQAFVEFFTTIKYEVDINKKIIEGLKNGN